VPPFAFVVSHRGQYSGYGKFRQRGLDPLRTLAYLVSLATQVFAGQSAGGPGTHPIRFNGGQNVVQILR
jgi:hypothetical protein